MLNKFDDAVEILLGHEKGYSNHRDDNGGETMWGVTISVARENGYHGEMKNMPVAVAKEIYRKKYWIDTLPDEIAYQVFDAAVNSGMPQAVRWLQRAVGVKDDGAFGPVTLSASWASDAAKVIMSINGQRLEMMTGLDSWKTFSRGWARRIAANLKEGAK